MDFGRALRESRRSRGLTQEEVGIECGLSRQAVSLLEAGGGRVSTLLSVQAVAPVRIVGLSRGPSYGARVRSARGTRSIAHVAATSGLAQNTVRAIEADVGTVASLARIIRVVSPDALVEAVLVKRKRVWRAVHGRANPDRDVHDYYATPAPIARMLLDHEQFDGSILEPCVGTARVIEHVLRERGYNDVRCSDLLGTGAECRDFFDVTEPCTSIVSNPPFNRHVDFIQHAKRIATDKIAFLLPLNYLTGKKRHERVWDDRDFPLARVLIMNRGVNFLTADPFAERLGASQLYCAWFIFERGHAGPPTMRWIDNHALIERQGD